MAKSKRPGKGASWIADLPRAAGRYVPSAGGSVEYRDKKRRVRVKGRGNY